MVGQPPAKALKTTKKGGRGKGREEGRKRRRKNAGKEKVTELDEAV